MCEKTGESKGLYFLQLEQNLHDLRQLFSASSRLGCEEVGEKDRSQRNQNTSSTCFIPATLFF
jgi:hypothetical protein